jgi:hypothetical protein
VVNFEIKLSKCKECRKFVPDDGSSTLLTNIGSLLTMASKFRRHNDVFLNLDDS